MTKNVFYVLFLTLILLLLSTWKPKIAMSLSGLILLGVVLLNINSYTKLLTPKEG